jgi:hypothetical protein
LNSEMAAIPVGAVSADQQTKLVSAIGKFLEDEKDDWQKRFKKMQELEMWMTREDDPVQFTAKEVQALRAPLLLQVADLRSTLAKQACQTVVRLAETQSASFASSSQIIINSILKQTTTTVKVISEAAHNTVCNLLRLAGAMPIGKALPEIMKGLQDSNPVLRRNCSLYLWILLKDRSSNQLLPYFDEFVPVISILGRDGDATTRLRARAIYAQLSVLSPTHAQAVMDSADRRLKDLLLEDAAGLGDLDSEELLVATPVTSAGSRPASRVASRNPSRNPSRAQSRSTSPTRGGSTSTPSTPITSSYAAPTKSSASKTTQTAAIPRSSTASPSGLLSARNKTLSAVKTPSTGSVPGTPAASKSSISPRTPVSSTVSRTSITAAPRSGSAPSTTSKPTATAAAAGSGKKTGTGSSYQLDMDVVLSKLSEVTSATGVDDDSSEPMSPGGRILFPADLESDIARELPRLRRLIARTQRHLDSSLATNGETGQSNNALPVPASGDGDEEY